MELKMLVKKSYEKIQSIRKTKQKEQGNCV